MTSSYLPARGGLLADMINEYPALQDDGGHAPRSTAPTSYPSLPAYAQQQQQQHPLSLAMHTPPQAQAHGNPLGYPPSTSASTSSLGLLAAPKLEPIGEDDASVPFFYCNMLQAGLNTNANLDPAHGIPFAHEGPRSTMTASSSSLGDGFDAWSAFSGDSRPQTTSFTAASNASDFGTSLESFSFVPSPQRSPTHGEMASDPLWDGPAGFTPSAHGPLDPMPRSFTTADASSSRPFTAQSTAFPCAPPPTSWGLDPIPDMSLGAMTLQDGQPSPRPSGPSTAAAATSHGPAQTHGWSTGDSLATWLNHDVLSDLLDEIKGEHPGPISEEVKQDHDGRPVAVTDRVSLYRRRRNAIAQLPLVVSCGVLSAMVSNEPESGSDIAQSSSPSSSSDEDGDEMDDQDSSGVLSPLSCPLSPTACPLSPKSSRPRNKVARSASCSSMAELPEMHRTLSSWNFACRSTGRYRSSSSAAASKSNKRDKQDAVRDAAAKASKASAAKRRGRRPRSQSQATEAMDIDPAESDSEAELASPKKTADACAKTIAASSQPGKAAGKPKRSSAKSANGKSFSIMSRIVLRPRPGTEDEEVAYPCLPDTLEEAKRNNGPSSDMTQGEEPTDESQSLFPSDLYAPRLTRRGPNGREGWCSLCTEGEWYSMKRSQYLYHIQYDHGVSSLTRKVFHAPTHIRVWNDAVEKTEGLCHHCQQWIPICFGPVRKRDFKAWFKHAHKCHRDKTGCPI